MGASSYFHLDAAGEITFKKKKHPMRDSKASWWTCRMARVFTETCRPIQTPSWDTLPTLNIHRGGAVQANLYWRSRSFSSCPYLECPSHEYPIEATSTISVLKGKGRFAENLPQSHDWTNLFGVQKTYGAFCLAPPERSFAVVEPFRSLLLD
ncbi:hypothetical protein VNO77_42079 [Canavalia gladiata]|uniref:Uncharacterized protein n=1 Tax=Canavalia gladiata TaxID=3824 RepID=A0AAN9K0E0_CANGL